MIHKIKDIIRRSVYGIIPPPYVPASYSQAGEDAILSFLFRDMGISQIKYLDIGTNVPDFGNNTYLFYRNNSNGVCVEADVTFIKDIQAIRPRDRVIHAGVAVSDEKEADFYVFDEPSVNTFNKEEAGNRNRMGPYKIVKVIKVPLIGINELIQDNFNTYPDLLSLDIEGLDLEVLRSLDYQRYPLPVICVETCEYSVTHIRPKNTDISEFLLNKGYRIYADTYINTIFVNKKWFDK